MRQNTCALAVALLSLLAAGARADDVELRTGRTLSGKIIKEDEASVTIEFKAGEMTIQRTQIKEVRKSPPPAAPATTTTTGKSGTKKPADAASQRVPPATPPKDAKPAKSFADRLAEIEAIHLAAWPEEPSVPCTEPEAKNYKVVRTDGSTSMRDERPSSTAGIESLYMRNDADQGAMIVWKDGARQLYWYRLYWHDDDKEWRVTHPDLEAFQLDSARAKRLAGDVCPDQGAMAAAAGDAQTIKYGMQGSTSYDAARERAKLVVDCRKAMGSDAGGDALAEFHECDARIDFAKSPAEKIRGAMERRAILRRLVAATLVK